MTVIDRSRQTRIVKDRGTGRFGDYELRVVAHEEVTQAKIVDADGKELGEVTVKFDDHPEVKPDPHDRYLLDPKRPKSSIASKAKGAAKLVQTELGINIADPATIAARKAICVPCDLNDIGRCMGKVGCKCYLWSKIRIPKEQCPKGLW